MLRWPFAVAFVLAIACSRTALADDREELRAKILKKVEERLKEENKRVLDEVKKILDEELGKADEMEPPVKVEPKKTEPKKTEPPVEPKKTEPKKTEPKKDEPGFMGVVPDDLTESMRKLLKLKEGQGVLVIDVAANGPAKKSGVKANDVVLEVDGESVGSGEELREAVTSHKAGETVTLKVLRKKETLEIKVKLATQAEVAGGGGDEGDEGDETGEGDEKDEEKPPAKDEKPVKKPKVIFEPRVQAPKFSEKSADELRDEIRKFLDEALKSENAKPATKKVLLPAGNFFIADGDEEDGGDGDEEPAPKTGKEMREQFKKFLRGMLEKLDEMDQAEENGEEPDFQEQLRKMMEQFQGLKGEEMEKLKEKLQEQFGKLGNGTEMLEKMLEGLKDGQIPDALKKLLGQGGETGPDDEDLTKPEDEKEEPAPKDPPKEAPKKAARAWLGVGPEAVGDDMLKQLKIEKGVLVREVVAGSPAEEAGLKEGDVLLSIDGQELGSPEDLQNAIAGRKVGADVTLSIIRKGKHIEKKVTLAARKKISVEAKQRGETFFIGDGEKPAKKKAKKGKAKKTVVEEKEANPMELGMDFAKQAGLRFAILDKNGKVLFSQPLENMQSMMEMAQKFGFGAPQVEMPRVKLYKSTAPDQLFLRDGGKKPSKKKAKLAEETEGCEECPMQQLFQGKGELQNRLGDARKEIEKVLRAHGMKGTPKLKVEERRVEKPGKTEKKSSAKQEKALRIELKQESGKKPTLKVEGDGSLSKKDIERIEDEIRKAIEENGGDGMPAELRKELEKLHKDLQKKSQKHRMLILAA